jgi:two-component system, NtrC family, sensor kinase
VRPFSGKQIGLLTNFAAQAVIAIENTRLLSELRESLQQQTATADVLKVISRSTFDLQAVLDTLVQSAARLCEADTVLIGRPKGESFQYEASYGYSREYAEFLASHPAGIDRGTSAGRAFLERKIVHILDVLADPEYTYPVRMADNSKVDASRTLLGVPLLREGSPMGVMILGRKSVRPFTDKQIELSETFADQAVIAIENTRLFEAEQQRTRELSESLQQQTATADVLKVISRSTFDLQTVLITLVESAAHLCEADMAIVHRLEGSISEPVAAYGISPELHKRLKMMKFEPDRTTVTGRVLLEHRAIHVHDLRSDPEISWVRRFLNNPMSPEAEMAGARTALGVPLLREGSPIGLFVVLRCKVQPFTGRQIELLETFADQAVIAIENARLFDEVQARTRDLSESLQQQTATADVLKAISRSAFDLKIVLDALVEAAARLCEADQGTIARERDGVYQRVATYGFSDDFTEYLKTLPVIPERGTATGRALLEGKVVHIPDVQADPEYSFTEAQKLGGFRTVVSLPMLREGVPIGVLALTRHEVRPFTEKQIELVSTFADQAAIAIENVRLFESVEARTRELAKSLEDLRTAQDRLIQTEKLASLGQLTAGIAHEIKNPLNFVNNFSTVSVELIDELREALGGAHLDSKLRAEISEIADTLQRNLDKVVQHGKRADAIVKNMLLHSRQGSGEHRPVDINALVDESLNLAYHGARAEKQGFTITLERSFDPAAGEVDLFPQEITRALLNLISNGFYAATKRKAEANGGDYEPTLAAATKNLGDNVEIRIRDNGTGIPPEVKEKLFSPFFTTKPAGEGTGLGLSISHDIIVKQHGGSIEVDTQPGAFTEFRIVLPRAGTALIGSGERA